MTSNIFRTQHLRLLALLETKVDMAKKHLIVNKLSYGWRQVTNSSFVNPCRIWISLDPRVFLVDVLKGSDQILHLRVWLLDGKVDLMITVVYAAHTPGRRRANWDSLMELATSCVGPWVVM